MAGLNQDGRKLQALLDGAAVDSIVTLPAKPSGGPWDAGHELTLTRRVAVRCAPGFALVQQDALPTFAARDIPLPGGILQPLEERPASGLIVPTTDSLIWESPDPPPVAGEEVLVLCGISYQDPAEPLRAVRRVVDAVDRTPDGQPRLHFRTPFGFTCPVYSMQSMRDALASIGAPAESFDKLAPWGQWSKANRQGRMDGTNHGVVRFASSCAGSVIEGLSLISDGRAYRSGTFGVLAWLTRDVEFIRLAATDPRGAVVHIWNSDGVDVAGARVAGAGASSPYGAPEYAATVLSAYNGNDCTAEVSGECAGLVLTNLEGGMTGLVVRARLRVNQQFGKSQMFGVYGSAAGVRFEVSLEGYAGPLMTSSMTPDTEFRDLRLRGTWAPWEAIDLRFGQWTGALAVGDARCGPLRDVRIPFVAHKPWDSFPLPRGVYQEFRVECDPADWRGPQWPVFGINEPGDTEISDGRNADHMTRLRGPADVTMGRSLELHPARPGAAGVFAGRLWPLLG